MQKKDPPIQVTRPSLPPVEEYEQLVREIFASPDIAPIQDKFVLGLAGRDVQVRRKAGWWENWFLDTAAVTGGGRHYIVVAMTRHPKGDDYLVEFAAAVDDLLTQAGPKS